MESSALRKTNVKTRNITCAFISLVFGFSAGFSRFSTSIASLTSSASPRSLILFSRLQPGHLFFSRMSESPFWPSLQPLDDPGAEEEEELIGGGFNLDIETNK